MNAQFQVEDRVKLCSMPAEIEAEKIRFPETYDLCSKALGHNFAIRGFNEYGMAELWIDQTGRNSGDACADSVWIEPTYLKLQSRSAPC